MKSRTYTLLLCFIISGVFFWGDAALGQEPTLKFGGPLFPPYFEIQGETPVGGAVPLLTSIIQGAGFKPAIEVQPAVRLIQKLEEGEIDMAMLVQNDSLDVATKYVRSPLSIWEVVLNLYSHAQPVEIRSREDLRGKRIAVIRGYGYGGLRDWMALPENNILLTEVYSPEVALRVVSHGRVPFALLYEDAYQVEMRQLRESLPNIQLNSFQRIPSYLYLHRRAVADPEARMAAMMAAYRDLVLKGRMARLPGQEEFLETGALSR